MPKDELDPYLFAPCGMNCMVCYKHCYHKKPCGGCRISDLGKPEHCRNCKLKDCLKSKGLEYCYECPGFPCKQLKSLDRSYRTRYGASLLEHSLYVKEHGLRDFMKQQKVKYTCPVCGGVISIHDGECSECRAKIK